jgi:hypothetical protein
MDLGVLRDFVIVIGGFLLLILIVVAGIFGFLLYRDIQSLIYSVKSTIRTATQLGAGIGPAMKSIKTIMAFFKRKEEKCENKSK